VLQNRRILLLLPNKPHTSSTKAVTLLADIYWLMNRCTMNNNKQRKMGQNLKKKLYWYTLTHFKTQIFGKKNRDILKYDSQIVMSFTFENSYLSRYKSFVTKRVIKQNFYIILKDLPTLLPSFSSYFIILEIPHSSSFKTFLPVLTYTE
jgi:hypothetical protein